MTSSKRNADGTYELPVGVEHVGASILDIVSGAMYSNALDVLREYIQNAVDGGAGAVSIHVRQHDILIRDDGRGLTIPQLDEARKVAVSRKGRSEVGFRGIGIYSSFSVCEALEVITRPVDSDEVFLLRVDYAPMRDAIRRAREEGSEPVPLIEALARYTRLADYTESIPLDAPGSFTLIRLVGPEKRFRDRLNDVAAVEAYLRRAVPLEFHPDFAHAETIRKGLKKLRVPLHLVSVSLKPSGARKALDLYQANVPDLLRPVIRPVRDGSRVVAVMWWCANRARKVIKDEAVSGFQTRFRGFGIGDRRLLRHLWPGLGSGVLYRSVVGEIHVLDQSLTPSAERGNFEDTRSREMLFDLLKAEFTVVNELTGDRRDALVDIDKGFREGDTDRMNEGFDNIEVVRPRFLTDPPLTLEEVLDAPGRRIHAQREAARKRAEEDAAGDAKDDTKEGTENAESGAGDEGGDANTRGQGSGQQDDSAEDDEEGGEEDEAPPPSIADILMGLEIEWPSDARSVFETIDNALIEVVERRNVEVCRVTLRSMLQRRYAYRDDLD